MREIARTLSGIALLGAVAATTACTAGSVDLILDIPDADELAPRGPTSVTLVASSPGAAPRATTSQIDADRSFDLGELPVGANLELAVELRDPTQRLVGYGRAPAPVSISADDDLEVVVPVRRPFAYVTGARDQLVALDTTREAGDAGYQATIPVPLNPTLAVPAGGGDVVLIAGGGDAQRVSTATHLPVDGPALSLPIGVRDAVTSPDGEWLLVAHDGGIALAQLSTGQVRQLVTGQPVDRVAIAANPGGGLAAVGLIGRADEPGCTVKSKLATVPVDGGEPVISDTGRSLADVGASPSQARIVGADACQNILVPVGEDAEAPKLADLSQPSAVSVLGDRVFGVGTVPARLSQGFAVEAARLQVVAVGIGGQQASTVVLPPIIESMVSLNVEGEDLARNLKAESAVAIDLSVVPPGDLLAIVYEADFSAPTLVDRGGVPIIPSMQATANEYVLVDIATGGYVQRVRSRCDLTTGVAQLGNWECRTSTGQDEAQVGDFTPSTVAVLYGAR